MTTTKHHPLVSACGFYCGACKKYQRGDCPGCVENRRSSWGKRCKVRLCCSRNGYHTCGECTTYDDTRKCRKLNSVFVRFFAVLVGYDRPAGIAAIRRLGEDGFAKEMEAKNAMWIARSRGTNR